MSKLSTTKICVKSPAKINLHLEIIGKREDGYHELAMIMQNIDLSDYIEFENNQIENYIFLEFLPFQNRIDIHHLKKMVHLNLFLMKVNE